MLAMNRRSLRARWRDTQFARRLLSECADSYVRRCLVFAFLIMATSAVLSALTPIALKFLIDSLQKPGGAHHWAPMLLAAYVASEFLQRILSALQPRFHGRGEQRLRRSLSRRMFEHILSLPLRFHLDRSTGAIGEILTQGINGYEILLRHILNTLLPVVVECTSVALILVQFGHAKYLGILLGAAFAYAIAFGGAAASVAQPAKAISSAQVRAHAALTDALLNCEAVKCFDGVKPLTRRFDHMLGAIEVAWDRYFGKTTSNGVYVAAIFCAALGSACALALDDVHHGLMTPGDFVLVTIYVARVVQPIEQIGYAVRDISQGMSLLGRLLDLFREPSEEPAKQRLDSGERPVIGSGDSISTPSVCSSLGSEPSFGHGSIAFEDVKFAYTRARPVLNGVTFRIAPGRTLGIVGASGGGKSSLIRLLFRLYSPDVGRILLDDRDLTSLRLEEIRRAIAIVPQDTVLFNDSIGNNIAFARDGASRTEIEAAARVAHLHAFISALPEGYDTQVGERGLKLSGGEKQRVAIARAALKRPQVFVFDEATSSLDSRTEAEILANLRSVAVGCTTLIIAHRLSAVTHADEILVLKDGHISERGSHRELMIRPDGVYAELWRAQHRHVLSEALNVTASG